MPLFYIDYWYVVLVLPVLIISMIIQAIMKSTYRKYSQIPVRANLTGADMAGRVLRENGVFSVKIEQVGGELSDHYDPKKGVIRLSNGVYSGRSVAALGVACHEAGHAVQHSQSYAPLSIRNSIAPAVSFCSSISWFVLVIGLVMQADIMIQIGIILFASAAVFQFITLPVELNASKRAVAALRRSGSLSEEELRGAKKVLTAAAMTYVAALAASVASLIRVILLAKGNNRRR